MPIQYDKAYHSTENQYKEREDKRDPCGPTDKKDDYRDAYGPMDKKDDCGCGCDGKSECPILKHSEPKKILLECGCKPQDVVFDTCDGWDKKEPFYVLDAVIIDTFCLGKSLVKIEFSSLVFFKAKTKYCPRKEIKIDLLFELVRSCKNDKDVLQSWRYLKKFETEYDDRLEVEFSEPFTVTFCDKACPDFCEYKMIVKAIGFEGEIEFVKVLKPDLSALAQRID